MTRWAVVLAGGVGSRFWPLSTPSRPKQLLPLVTDEPMLAATLRRLRAVANASRTLVLTNASLVDAVHAMASHIPRANIIAEPRQAGTAAALAWAARRVAEQDGPDAVMVCVHADWAIGDESGFAAALDRAATSAGRHRALVTVGVVPSRPDIGFGYIQPGEEVPGDAAVRRVKRFIEKPDRAGAESLCAEGCLWNSGIFAWRAGDFLDELHLHTPEVAPALDAAHGDAEKFFASVTPVSVDVGVLERSERVMVLSGDFDWDDVGTWAALARVRHRDDQGNAASGNVFAIDAARNVTHADAGTVVLYGVSDLVVVARDGLVLVTTTDRAADLKTLIEALPASVRERG